MAMIVCLNPFLVRAFLRTRLGCSYGGTGVGLNPFLVRAFLQTKIILSIFPKATAS